MRTSTWLSGRRTAGVLVGCLLVWGVAPPPAAAQCESAKLLAFDGSGSAYIFRFNGVSWVQEAKLTASDGAANDNFGWSVSISGDAAVIGARDDDANGIFSGSAYVFEKPPGGWVNMTETAKLTASDGAAVDQFGSSVLIGGDVITVGAVGDDDNGEDSGSMYV